MNKKQIAGVITLATILSIQMFFIVNLGYFAQYHEEQIATLYRTQWWAAQDINNLASKLMTMQGGNLTVPNGYWFMNDAGFFRVFQNGTVFCYIVDTSHVYADGTGWLVVNQTPIMILDYYPNGIIVIRGEAGESVEGGLP